MNLISFNQDQHDKMFSIFYLKWKKESNNRSTDQTSFLLNYLSDKLHNLSQVLLLLQDLLGLCTQRHKLREVLVVMFIEGTSVLAVADEPVY